MFGDDASRCFHGINAFTAEVVASVGPRHFEKELILPISKGNHIEVPGRRHWRVTDGDQFSR
jgi:hypothetical protein